MRRILLLALIIILVAAAAAGGGLLYLNSTIGSHHLLALVNEMVMKETGLKLVWQEARGSFLFNVVAEKPALIMADGDTLVEARTIRIGFRPWTLLEGGIELTRVEVDAPVVNIPALSGGFSKERSKSKPDTLRSREGSQSGLRLRRIIIRNGKVRIGRRGVIHTIDRIQVRASLQINRAGGLQIDIDRSRATIENWGIVVEDLQGGVIVKGGMVWLLDTRARTRDSRLSVDGSMDVSRAGRRGALRVDLTARNLQEWWPVLGGSWIGNGPLEMEGWLRGKPWRPEIDFSGHGLIAGISVEGFRLEGSYNPGSVEAQMYGWGPAADMINAHLALNPKSGEGWFEIAADSLRMNNTPLQIPLTAERVQVDFQFQSFDPVSVGGELNLKVVNALAFGVEIDSLNTVLQLGDGNITTVEPIVVSGAGYGVEADGMISLNRKAIDLTISGIAHEPSQPLTLINTGIEEGTIELGARITGAIVDPSIRGGIQIKDFKRKGISIGYTDFRFNIAQVFGARIGNFGADLDSVHVAPGFDLPIAGLDGRIMGETISLQRVEGLWDDGETGLQGNIVVSRDSIRARFDSGHLAHREVILSDINGELVFDPTTGAGSFAIATNTSEGALSLSGYRDAEQRLHINGDMERIRIGPFNRTFNRGAGRLDGQVSGIFSGELKTHVEKLSTEITIVNPTLAGLTFESLQLDADYRNGAVRVNNLTVSGSGDVASGITSLQLEGTLSLPGSEVGGQEGQLDIDCEIIGVNLAVLQPYLAEHTLSGELWCEMSARGSFTEPIIDGWIYLNAAQVNTYRIDQVVAGLIYKTERIEIYEGHLESMDFAATFSGEIPFQLKFTPLQAQLVSTGDLQIEIAGSGSPEALLQSVSRQIENVGGDFTVDVQVVGTVNEPRLSGNIRLENGELKPVALGQAIEDLNMDLTLSEDSIRIVSFTGRMPGGMIKKWSIWDLFNKGEREQQGGDFSLSGDVTLGGMEKPRFNLTFIGDGMGISDPTGSLAAVIDADLRIVTREGNSFSSLEGKVQVQQGVADVGMLLNMLGVSETTLERESEDREGMEMDVEVEIPGRLMVIGGEYGQEFDVELAGNLLLRKNPTGSPYLLGSLESVMGQGQLFMFSKKWSIDEGTITFGSIEEINPNLDARFSTSMDEDLIVLTLTGTVVEPQTRLSVEGNSMLGTSDIYELLILGTFGVGGELGGTGQVIGKYIENQVNRTARGIIGFDTFEMEGLSGWAQGSRGENTRLSVGNYFFGNQLYAKYAQSFGGSTPWMEFGVEYRLSRRLRISGMKDKFGSYLLELKWRVEY